MLTQMAQYAIIIFVSCADVAQLVEQLIRNEQVVGSNPIISSSEIKPSEVFGGLFFCSKSHETDFVWAAWYEYNLRIERRCRPFFYVKKFRNDLYSRGFG